MIARWWRTRRVSARQAAADRAARTALARVVAARPVLDPLQPADPDQNFELRWRGAVKGRLLIVLYLLAAWTAAVEIRLVWLQLVLHDEMVARAMKQQEHVVTLRAARGDIVDRNGELLAYSVDGHTLVADPSAIAADRKSATANEICRALTGCHAEQKSALLKQLLKSAAFVYLDRRLSAVEAERLEQLKLPGVRVIPEPRRYYPKVELASHVLGFAGIDNDGLGGIEGAYDKFIHGSEGRMLLQVDARQARMDSRVQQPPEAGATVELTLDVYLQHIAERELRAGVQDAHALGGTAIIMNPWNGEILALASYPTFNPNAVQDFGDDAKRNRAVQDIYEPGSTFKIVTVSAALEEGVFSVNDSIDTNPGRITFGSRVIDEDKGHNYGVLSFGDVIVRSSNVGATRIGLRVGAERMARFVQRFGFGQALLPDLRGQSRGIVYSASKLDDSSLASVAMGYQIGVTPLQMASATSVVANGGTLYEPRLVRAIIRGNEREPINPKSMRRVISSETAAALTTMMEGVVERGTATRAKLDDFPVAGKTGTASKLVHGQYSHTDYNVSFVGFVPSRRPVLTILVVVDTPRNGSPYGGIVAAPIFRKIADASLRQLAVTPTINPPPVVIASAAADTPAQHISGPAVRPEIVPLGGDSVMPDVRGMSARDAVRLLSAAGLTVGLTGVGTVTTQVPEPGEPIEAGGWSRLELRRGSLREPAAAQRAPVSDLTRERRGGRE